MREYTAGIPLVYSLQYNRLYYKPSNHLSFCSCHGDQEKPTASSAAANTPTHTDSPSLAPVLLPPFLPPLEQKMSF